MNEVFADPQVQHIGIAAEANHPRLGRYKLVAQPAKLSRTPATVASATPELGEHTEEILKELGFQANEISSLRNKGAI
jgi:crotonobetainyl-CoA:carnitine CoA-transferase CaiB-like acyl-CoA transferase